MYQVGDVFEFDNKRDRWNVAKPILKSGFVIQYGLKNDKYIFTIVGLSSDFPPVKYDEDGLLAIPDEDYF